MCTELQCTTLLTNIHIHKGNGAYPSVYNYVNVLSSVNDELSVDLFFLFPAWHFYSCKNGLQV